MESPFFGASLSVQVVGAAKAASPTPDPDYRPEVRENLETELRRIWDPIGTLQPLVKRKLEIQLSNCPLLLVEEASHVSRTARLHDSLAILVNSPSGEEA